MGLLQAIGLVDKNNQLAIGARAPQLTALDEQGNKVDLVELFASGLTLVYFFPKALTPVCTAQACEFRDNYKKLQDQQIRIFGVSRDRAETLTRFKEKHHLPFPLLSDYEGRITKAFGVPSIFSVAIRQSFLIRQGVVVWRDLHPEVSNQTERILAAVADLKPA